MKRQVRTKTTRHRPWGKGDGRQLTTAVRLIPGGEPEAPHAGPQAQVTKRCLIRGIEHYEPLGISHPGGGLFPTVASELKRCVHTLGCSEADIKVGASDHVEAVHLVLHLGTHG